MGVVLPLLFLFFCSSMASAWAGANPKLRDKAEALAIRNSGVSCWSPSRWEFDVLPSLETVVNGLI
jgi:hypothetical protein